MNLKIAFSIVALAGFLGCATSPELEHQVVTEIISEPPGARIEVNGNYLGEAPVTTKIRHHASDKVVVGTVTIKAYPVEEGQYEQTKIFQGPLFPFDPHRDVVPERVFFDMTRRN